MSTLLKDLYSPSFYQTFSDALAITLPDFDRDDFMRQIFSPEFDGYELKQRMSHTAVVLRNFLGGDFGAAIDRICRIIENLRGAGVSEQSMEYMFLPEYIERYGIYDYETSIAAFETVTRYTSCEFAVRPYIVSYGKPMLEQMLAWSLHDDNRVRRLASEGSRPRLPWAMALPDLKRDPTPILPILENLKRDECEIVRRSVANNLNDISKDNPLVTLGIGKSWIGDNPLTDALLKHGCRTLLKKSDTGTLALFGFDSNDLERGELRVLTPKVTMGEQLEFAYDMTNVGDKAKKIRIEYAIHLLKNNGRLSKKVFKISEREIAAGERFELIRKHRFKPITTRRYYPGRHAVSIIVNGAESCAIDFELVM